MTLVMDAKSAVFLCLFSLVFFFLSAFSGVSSFCMFSDNTDMHMSACYVLIAYVVRSAMLWLTFVDKHKHSYKPQVDVFWCIGIRFVSCGSIAVSWLDNRLCVYPTSMGITAQLGQPLSVIQHTNHCKRHRLFEMQTCKLWKKHNTLHLK